MITRDAAKAISAPLFDLPFALGDALVSIVLDRFMDCTDEDHARRAVRSLIEISRTCPSPAVVIRAIRDTVRPGDTCQTCGGTGIAMSHQVPASITDGAALIAWADEHGVSLAACDCQKGS